MNSVERSVLKAIEEGRGVGFGDRYKPWIQITRRRYSRISNLNLGPVPYLQRLTHFLSRSERQLAFLLLWAGATDVREQFPLWPWAHPQPLAQLDGRKMDRHPGMEAVAREAGIKLGKYPGLSIRAILTQDIVATIPATISEIPLKGFSCKPRLIYEAAPTADPLRERLELDRRYCVAAQVPHRVVHPEQYGKRLHVQLDWLAPWESRAELARIVLSLAYQRFVEELRRTAYEIPVHRASQEASVRAGLAPAQADRALHIAIWYQHLDVDLRQPVNMCKPLRPGGVALRRALQMDLLGGAEPC